MSCEYWKELIGLEDEDRVTKVTPDHQEQQPCSPRSLTSELNSNHSYISHTEIKLLALLSCAEIVSLLINLETSFTFDILNISLSKNLFFFSLSVCYFLRIGLLVKACEIFPN